jgi:hypothetical protein
MKLPTTGATPQDQVASLRTVMQLVYEQGYKEARSWLSTEKGIDIDASAE